MSATSEHKAEEDASQNKTTHKLFDSGFLFLIIATLGAGIAVTVKFGFGHVVAVSLGALGFFGLLVPKIAAGMFIAAAIPILVPRDKISRWIGRDSGVAGLIFATFAGAMLPGGPSMIFPLTGAILVSGADLAAGLAFVTGWSLFNMNRTLIWELSFLPSDFVALRVLFCLPLPVLLGLAVRAFWGRA